MQLGPTFGIANVIVPSGGPKAVSNVIDFSNSADVELSGEAIVSQGKIEYLQGVYIDNADNVDPFVLTIVGTNQRITCKGKTQGYFSILCPNPPDMNAHTTQSAANQIRVIFYNVPVQPAVWSVV